ncbi:MAG: hypothetical protein PHU16_11205, partial [Atribacterota bacterium]|nr:hypothetical protein [Atribacterota bacterium]
DPSLCEGVWNSSFFRLLKNILTDEILTSHNTLLRMTKWMVEIATSSNQRTVELLTRTDLGNYFHPYLVTKNETRVYLENPWA